MCFCTKNIKNLVTVQSQGNLHKNQEPRLRERADFRANFFGESQT